MASSNNSGSNALYTAIKARALPLLQEKIDRLVKTARLSLII
jgi:hypothetical protein